MITCRKVTSSAALFISAKAANHPKKRLLSDERGYPYNYSVIVTPPYQPRKTYTLTPHQSTRAADIPMPRQSTRVSEAGLLSIVQRIPPPSVRSQTVRQNVFNKFHGKNTAVRHAPPSLDSPKLSIEEKEHEEWQRVSLLCGRWSNSPCAKGTTAIKYVFVRPKSGRDQTNNTYQPPSGRKLPPFGVPLRKSSRRQNKTKQGRRRSSSSRPSRLLTADALAAIQMPAKIKLTLKSKKKRRAAPCHADACFFLVKLTVSRFSTCSKVCELSRIFMYAACSKRRTHGLAGEWGLFRDGCKHARHASCGGKW